MIYLINSTDGIHWNKAGTPYIGLQSTPNTIYGASLSLYKPTILIEPDKTRIWYGDLYPKNIWKIEYTEETKQTQPVCSTYELTYIRTQIAKIKEQLTILEEMVK